MRCAARLALLALVLACASLASAKLTFTVLGDWGETIDYAATIAQKSQKLGAAFVLALGDNFYDVGVTSTSDEKWRTVFENVYTQPFFKKKWYVIAGNHDYEGNVKAQLDYSKRSNRWTFPSRYYKFKKSFGSGTVEFFMLDTVPLFYTDTILRRKYNVNNFDAKQFQWLERALARSTATWKLVVGHHQAYTSRSRHAPSARFLKHLTPLLKKHRIPAYINGHLHHAEHLVKQKVHYITTGNVAHQDFATTRLPQGASKKFLYPLESDFAAKCVNNGCLGFTIMTIKDAKSMKVAYLDKGGNVLKTVTVPNRR